MKIFVFIFEVNLGDSSLSSVFGWCLAILFYGAYCYVSLENRPSTELMVHLCHHANIASTKSYFEKTIQDKTSL